MHDMAEDVNGAIWFMRGGGGGWCIGVIKISGSTRAGFNDQQIEGIAFNGKEHVTGSQVDGSIGMVGAVVLIVVRVHCGFGSFGLFSGELTDGCEEHGVNGTGIVGSRMQRLSVALGAVVSSGKMANCVLVPY